MNALDRLIALNVRNKHAEQSNGTGSERIALNELMIEQERILKAEIGEPAFDEVIDAIIAFTDGHISEDDVRKIYANKRAP